MLAIFMLLSLRKLHSTQVAFTIFYNGVDSVLHSSVVDSEALVKYAKCILNNMANSTKTIIGYLAWSWYPVLDGNIEVLDKNPLNLSTPTAAKCTSLPPIILQCSSSDLPLSSESDMEPAVKQDSPVNLLSCQQMNSLQENKVVPINLLHSQTVITNL